MDMKFAPLTISVVQLLIEPGEFFRGLTRTTSLKKAMEFIGLGSVFYAVSSLLIGASPQAPWPMGAIFFFNALGACLISSLIAYGIGGILCRQKIGVAHFFMIHAFAWGITLFLSWLPFLLWLTEPWKWWLIYLGYRHSCRIGQRMALCIVGGTLVVQFSLFYWVMPFMVAAS